MTVATDDAVIRRADELLLTRDAHHVSQAGYRQYGATWDASVNQLNAIGLNSADVVVPVMEIAGREKTHEVMHALAQDPEKAAAIARMSPARRIAEITKIADRMSSQPSASEPAAPATPATTIPASTRARAAAAAPASAEKPMTKYDDRLSDEEFSRQFDEAARERDRIRKGK